MTNPLELISPETEVVNGDEASDRVHRGLLIARCQGQYVGVFADQTDGIVEWRKPAALPRSGPAILGIISVRGRMFTVVDPSFLVQPEKMGLGEYKFVVMLRGADQLGLAVEKVISIPEIYLDELETAPPDEPPTSIFGRCRHENLNVSILRTEQIFDLACGLN